MERDARPELLFWSIPSISVVERMKGQDLTYADTKYHHELRGHNHETRLKCWVEGAKQVEECVKQGPNNLETGKRLQTARGSTCLCGTISETCPPGGRVATSIAHAMITLGNLIHPRIVRIVQIKGEGDGTLDSGKIT